MSVKILMGDCLEVMGHLIDEGVKVDSIVTDPPYHLTSIVKRFGGKDAAPCKSGKTGAYKRHSTGFMGKKWDGGDIAFQPDVWRLCFDLLKPGGHMLVFGGTRTYHRMACAVEDAGFEIRDQIGWLFGSGFPKSHDVSKGIDRAAGKKGEYGEPKSDAHAGWIKRGAMRGNNGHEGYQRPWIQDAESVDKNARQYIPATEAAKQWEGWGTALKPAWEPILLARRPLIGTVAANVLEHSTGALNIDGCSVDTIEARPLVTSDRRLEHNTYGPGLGGSKSEGNTTLGRWPADVIHDGSPEVLEAFAQSGDRPTGGIDRVGGCKFFMGGDKRETAPSFHDNSGTAARFFYCAKADKKDRLGSKHPTVKPVDLMAYLCRLVTPPKGLVLDPFAGSGTTAMACIRESFDCILIEKEAEYVKDIKARLAHVKGADTPLFAKVDSA